MTEPERTQIPPELLRLASSRDYHRSINSDKLRAAGLPPSMGLAAQVIGISVNTLRKRFNRGSTSLTASVRKYVVRRTEDVAPTK